MCHCVCMCSRRTHPLLPLLLCSPRVCKPCNQVRRRWQTLRRNWWHSSRCWSGERPCGQTHSKVNFLLNTILNIFWIFTFSKSSSIFITMTPQYIWSMFSNVAFNLLFRLMSRSCSLLPVGGLPGNYWAVLWLICNCLNISRVQVDLKAPGVKRSLDTNRNGIWTSAPSIYMRNT